eukprot:Gb_24746 [translate_table: standard]
MLVSTAFSPVGIHLPDKATFNLVRFWSLVRGVFVPHASPFFLHKMFTTVHIVRRVGDEDNCNDDMCSDLKWRMNAGVRQLCLPPYLPLRIDQKGEREVKTHRCFPSMVEKCFSTPPHLKGITKVPLLALKSVRWKDPHPAPSTDPSYNQDRVFCFCCSTKYLIPAILASNSILGCIVVLSYICALRAAFQHLIQNEHLQEQQAAAARKVFDILSPPIKPLDGPTIEGFETSHLLQNMKSPMPSMLAAYTILSSLKWQG